ncbi:uncharacterized protein LOC132203576 [Neocloeon triangulifer]|uniref:uncharacterized protein LOC132203576 n=1 Tax=Neocloeon triangulifer TaxID=2078957 RepID=UPI00286F8943|nr:uncharacterized protein LOC132203576 [Neocloeon triangulifer]
MKALRLSPSSRRHERSAGSAGSSLFSLNHQLCLELDLCVHSPPPSPQPLTDVSMIVTLKALPLTDSCACQRIGQWLGHHDSAKECSTCDLEEEISELSAPTSLLVVRGALGKGDFEAAMQLAATLLQAGADPDETDPEGRTLLSHSVQHLDDSAALTRLLLNSGASVWHRGGTGVPDHSPFTWLLRALILRRRFENCDLTLEMLARVMGERPAQMKAHVLRVMFRHARCPKVLGPIFKRIKEVVSVYWTNAPSLQYSCLSAIRRRLAGRTAHGVPLLGLPPSLKRSLLMQDLF